MDISAHIDLLQRLWRRRLWLLVPVVAGAGAALVAVKNIQPAYRATAVVLIEAQKIPTSIVQDTVTTGIWERLDQVEQRVRHEEILEPIVTELNLYPELLQRGLVADAVSSARGALRVSKSRRERTVSISFAGHDQSIVAPAANRIAEAVIAENARLRESQATDTSAFIDAEIAQALVELEETAAEITRLEKRHEGRLPEERERNQRMAADLEQQIVSLDEGIERAETRRLLLREADESKRVKRTPPATTDLDRLRQEERRLLAQYTEKHPDVIRLRLEIAALEDAQIAAPAPEVTEEDVDPVLAAELASLDFELDRLKRNRGRVRAELGRYRALLRDTPEVETELESLRQQHRNLDGFYRFMLKKKKEAELAQNLEQSQKSEQLSLLRRARTPSGPYSPNVKYFLLVGTALGGVLGLLLALFREETDKTFADPEALRRAFPGAPLLSAIPQLAERQSFSYLRRSKARRNA